jgi:hypothetical protein
VLTYRPFASSSLLAPCRGLPGFEGVVTDPTCKSSVLKYRDETHDREHASVLCPPLTCSPPSTQAARIGEQCTQVVPHQQVLL